MTKFAFLCRARMVQVGANFKAGNNNPLCPICKIAYDSQNHLLLCPDLNERNIICKEVPQYEEIFKNNFKKKMAVVMKLWENFKKRQKLLSS